VDERRAPLAVSRTPGPRAGAADRRADRHGRCQYRDLDDGPSAWPASRVPRCSLAKDARPHHIVYVAHNQGE